MKIMLYRRVGQRWRYYKLSINKNLFGDYILSRQYGSIINSHSFEKINILKTKIEANNLFLFFLRMKLKKGYMKQQKERILTFTTEYKTGYAA